MPRVSPPSTPSDSPVMPPAVGPAKKATASATSAAVRMRRIGGSVDEVLLDLFCCDALSRSVLRIQLVNVLGLHHTRVQGVDGDAVRTELVRQRLRHVDDRQIPHPPRQGVTGAPVSPPMFTMRP